MQAYQLVAPHDHLVGVPSEGIADAGLVAQPIKIHDQILQLTGVSKQRDDFNRSGGLLRRANVRTHQTLKNRQRLVSLAEIRVDLAQPKTGLRAELGVLRGSLERLDGPQFRLRRVLINASPSNPKVAATGVLALGITLQAIQKTGLGFRCLFTEQIS